MKEIDAFGVAIRLFPIEVLGGLERALKELFAELPTKEGGIPVEEEDFVAAGVKLYFDHAKPLIESMLDGKLPDVSEDDLPQPEPTEPPNEFPGYKVVLTAACDDWMSYRDGDHSESVRQKKCLFRSLASYQQLPQGGFTIVWIDAAGKREFLHVSSSQVGNIAMGDINAGYRKYRWIDDIFPHPVAYAPVISMRWSAKF
jgi:hypothetical protein